jgi:hypothetical protein
MQCQRIATENLLAWVSYLALKLNGMPENCNWEFASLGLKPYFEAVCHARESQYEIASLGLIPRIEAVWHVRELQNMSCYSRFHISLWSSMACQRIATEKLLAWVSYRALKLYGMTENWNREIASLCLIPRFEAVWHVRESQQRIC